jgi:DNA mismatch repair protein MutS2
MNTIEQTIKALEWKTILGDLSKYATCTAGKNRCLNTEVFSNVEKVRYELKLTTEGKFLLDRNIFPPLGGICEISEFISMAAAGKTLRGEELIDIANTMAASRRLKAFFERYKEEIPEIYNISANLYENKQLEADILDIFDEAANMIDTASSELKRLSLSLKDQTFNLKNKLNSLINSSTFSKYLQENVFTMRGDRYVIPVKAEHKAHVQGIVHDVSASGATFFIEPKAIVELNNKLRELELQIEAEINRILAELSGRVREISTELKYTYEILGDIDFIFAKSKYSVSIQGTEPEINNKKFISLKNVRHPVLLRVVEKVVPNDIEIGNSFNMMIITGPNTGGKTVILKTVGICTLMAKAGMHVPAAEASIYPFKNIFADIGDEQSIIQSLSTFSGHIKNIISILEKTTDETLILLDELGAGTDPLEGTALAEAILYNIYEKGVRAIVTTHFSELKALAYTKQGFYNASVEFDTETLAPTYNLLMGIPGKSNAIFIAKKLGLEEVVAENAREIYLTRKDPTGQILEGLQDTQQQLSKNTEKAQEARANAEYLEKVFNEELEKIKSEKKKIIGIYKKKFDAELSKAKEEIKEILEEARRTKSEKIARRSMSSLGRTESGLRALGQEESEMLEPENEPLDWENTKVGDTVYIKHLDQNVILASLPDKSGNVQVEMGLLKSSVKANELFKPKSGKAFKPIKHYPSKEKPKDFGINRYKLTNTLDLRGYNSEDGIDKVEFYLDEASMTNLSPVYIIHGHGTGILRKSIREYLKTSPYVKNYRAGEQSEGGDGVTVVELV